MEVVVIYGTVHSCSRSDGRWGSGDVLDELKILGEKLGLIVVLDTIYFLIY